MPITHDFLRTIDWATTPIGPMDGWPQSLRSYVDLILGLPTPAIIFWGPAQTQIYNQSYSVIMGPRHPRYFGATYVECWPETYALIMPLMREVLDEGKTIEFTPEQPIMLTRHGFEEDAYFAFSFSPLRDDAGAIAGIYQPVVEMTQTVLRERRAETLRQLTAARDSLELAIAPLGKNPSDAPLVGVYLRSPGELRLAATTGSASLDACAQRLAPIASQLAEVVATNRSLEATLGGGDEPLRSVFVVPLRRSAGDAPLGAIAFGVSPRLVLDASYRAFFEAATREIATVLVAQRVEQAQREAKEAQARRMAVLFEQAPVGIALLHGEQHVFEVANPSYRELLPAHELLGRPIREALPELEGQGIFELLDHVFDADEPYLGRSIRLVIDGADGNAHERFFDFAYQPLRGEDGKPESILVVAFEITELSKARRAAEAASRAKDEFFAILGHELRNPLAPITTALQLMKLRGDDTLFRERTIIERQVEHMTRLLDDLLDVSRITRGKVTLERAPVEVMSVVATGIELASPLLEQRQHHLVVDVPASGLVVDGDAVRLAQVVSNLVANAAKYTEPGGRIRVSAAKAGARVMLQIEDTGIGIAPEMLPRVFEAFTQEQQTLERTHGGLGLGLAIVDSLVKLHGGAVTARSAGHGKGSTFIVELPLSSASPSVPPAPAAAHSDPAPLSGALRILVVDDNVDAAELLAEAVGSFGYHTVIAHDGAAALRMAEAFAPDVALLDIGLPVMDGYELAGRLRSGPRGERMKLVAITGYGQESDRRRTAAAGFDAHLVKPVQLSAIVKLIDEYRRALG